MNAIKQKSTKRLGVNTSTSKEIDKCIDYHKEQIAQIEAVRHISETESKKVDDLFFQNLEELKNNLKLLEDMEKKNVQGISK